MAAAAGDIGRSFDNNTEDTELLECGLCYENDDLKRLPCSPGHIFCVTCLTKKSEVTKIILCPVCKRVLEDTVDALPSATAPIDGFSCCYVCRRKDEKFKYAQVYCVICAKKLCDSHLKSHNDTLDDHKRIPMSDYRKEYRKMEQRYCDKHRNSVYSHGCQKCFAVLCGECISEPGHCPKGEAHYLVTLDRLALTLINSINEEKIRVFDKEEHLLGIVKVLTRRLSNWDSETEALVAELHKARNKQLDEIKLKYEAMENEILDSRYQSKGKLTQFLDDEVGEKLTKLTRELLKINARVSTHHKVDVVKGFKDMEKLMKELTEMKVADQQMESLEIVGKQDGRIAVALKTSSGPTITEQQVASCITVKPPTSFILLKSVELEGKPTSVCHYKEYTYTSLGSLSKVVPRTHLNGHVDNEFIKLEGNCRGLVVGNDLLHVLTRSPTAKVLTYNFDGRLIMGRATETHEYTATKFVITVDNKIVIVNQRDKQFVIFGSAMELERQVPCTTIPCENSAMSIAVIDYESVVISDFSSSKVSKVSLIDGHVIWTSDRVPYPQGVVCYKGHYVLVTNCEPDCKIWILDAKSGRVVGEIKASPGTAYTDRLDMAVNNDQLLITNYQSQTIEYYQIS